MTSTNKVGKIARAFRENALSLSMKEFAELTQVNYTTIASFEQEVNNNESLITSYLEMASFGEVPDEDVAIFLTNINYALFGDTYYIDISVSQDENEKEDPWAYSEDEYNVEDEGIW